MPHDKLTNSPAFMKYLESACDKAFATPIRPGDEIRCDAAKLLDDRVLIRRDGIWIELRPPKWDAASDDAPNANE